MTRFGGGPNDLIVRRRSKSSLSCNIVSRDRANSSGSSSSSIVENFYLDKNFHRFRKLAFFFFFAPVRFHLFRKKGIGVRIGTGSEFQVLVFAGGRIRRPLLASRR